MTDLPFSHPLRLSDLAQRKVTRLSITPDAEARKRLAKALDITALRKATLDVTLNPGPGRDWQLTGHLGATVVQPCGVTLDPVTTRIDEEITRHYRAEWEDIDASEAEMPEDDTQEPLPATLDLGLVLQEALALALPDFPRVEGVEEVLLNAAPPGADPLTTETVKPFAGLAKMLAPKDVDPDL